jgi:hypothetical protein
VTRRRPVCALRSHLSDVIAIACPDDPGLTPPVHYEQARFIIQYPAPISSPFTTLTGWEEPGLIYHIYVWISSIPWAMLTLLVRVCRFP